ncbi:MAG: GNAT family N-acetyltransferase [Capsulimonadaceae bacterium]|nr:GNAT family N-acetyltransferase [Capsulimonadaceae bacterium]
MPDRNLTARAITAKEMDQHFNLLCQSFQLDSDLAYPIYKQDPFFALDHKRALFDGAEMTAVLTLVPAALTIHSSSTLPVAGIAGVGVPPWLRGRGYATELIRQTVRTAYGEFGYALAALESDQPAFYRRLGFEPCSTVVAWSAAPGALPESPLAASVTILQPDVLALESLRIHALYHEAAASQSGVFQRDERRWEVIDTLATGRTVAVWRDADGGLAAYVAFVKNNGDAEAGWTITEMAAKDDVGRRALVGFLARQTAVRRISGRMSRSAFVEFGLDRIAGVTHENQDGVMLRILNLQAVLESLARSAEFAGRLATAEAGFTICVDNEDFPAAPVRLRLFTVADERGANRAVITPADELDGDCLAGDIGALTQLVLGYAPASLLKTAGRVRATTARAIDIAEQLFPPADIFLATPDRF